MERKWYRINNKNSDESEIMIFEEIGSYLNKGVSAKQFVQDLKSLESSQITLLINSPGGDVFEGNTIYNALRSHKARIKVKIMGVAASIASVIAVAGDNVEMPKNAMMMIHDPWSWAIGDAEAMEKRAELLRKIKAGIITAYQSKTGQKAALLSNLMSKETWLTAQEAFDYGFADTITSPVQAQANFKTLSYYKNVPEQLRNNATLQNSNNRKTTMNTEVKKRAKTDDEALEAYCKDQWHRDKEIRHEFQNYETYFAYMKYAGRKEL